MGRAQCLPPADPGCIGRDVVARGDTLSVTNWLDDGRGDRLPDPRGFPMRRRLMLPVALLLLVAGSITPLAAQGADPHAAECATTLPAADPLPVVAPPLPRALPDPMAMMPLDVKIVQMLIGGVLDTIIGGDKRQMIEDLHLGNVILMGRNVDSPDQVLALTQGLQGLARSSNGVGLLIATDQEGGLVQRLNSVSGFTPLPDAATTGSARCPALLRAYGWMAGEEMAAVGVNMAMAPVLDVNGNPTNPVIGSLGRSFGTSPEEVELAALPLIAGLHDAGVMATGKHFPGHGSTTADSHKSLPFVDKERAALEAVDIAPFRAAIDHGIDTIMPAHVVYSALDPSGMPATVSAPIQTGLLRGELGFTGLIVTDDMGMAGITEIYSPGESAVRAVEAGADLITCVRMTLDSTCPPKMLEQLRHGLMQAVADGRISRERIDASVRRILVTKSRYHVGPAPSEGLATIRGGQHFQALADLLAMVDIRQEEAGRP